MSRVDPAAARTAPADARAALRELVGERPVVICCGPGGVGKTTLSATLALQAARQGRRACVVTVDPARRLADALGVESLPNTPTLVPGDWPGELHALMLDTKGTFDELVHRYSRTAEQADSIIANRIYQNLAGALSGTQEYMAMEKLYELTQDDRFDAVVVDTPPTRNALDLLDAPRRLSRFLENKLFRTLLLPTRAYLRAVSVATQALLRTISKVAGAELVQDAVTFFQAFQGMEEGFRDRAGAVRHLLAEPSTAYVLVTSPRPDALEEAAYFAGKLSETGITPAALVVNRVHPHFLDAAAHDRRPGGPPPGGGGGGVGGTGGRVGTGGGGRGGGGGVAGGVGGDGTHSTAGGHGGLPPAPEGSDLAALEENLRRLEHMADREEAAYGALVERVSPAPVGRVPLLETDVHDVEGLAVVADLLFETSGTAGGVG